MTPHPMRAGRVELALLVAVPLLWGSAFVAIRAGLLAGASPFIFAEYRYVLATALVAIAAMASRQPLPDRRSFLATSLVGGVLMMGGYAGLLYWAEQYTSGGLASVLVSTAPVWTAIVAFPVLPLERLGRLGSAGVALGLAGVVVLFLPGIANVHSLAVPGLLAAAGSAALASVGAVMLRKANLRASSLWNLTGEFGIASLVLLVPALLLPGGLTFPVTTVTIGMTLYLAVGASVLGYGLYFHLLQRTGPARAMTVTYLNPLVGLTTGFLFLGESVTAMEIAGFALVLFAVLLLQLERRRALSGSGAS
jgi:probable blue pigment (indigoidine) exporter